MRRNKKPVMLMEKQQMNSRRKQCIEISQIPKQVRQDKIRFSWFVICLMILHFLYSDCPEEVHMWLEMKAKCEPMLLKQKTSFIPENPEASEATHKPRYILKCLKGYILWIHWLLKNGDIHDKNYKVASVLGMFKQTRNSVYKINDWEIW